MGLQTYKEAAALYDIIIVHATASVPKMRFGPRQAYIVPDVVLASANDPEQLGKIADLAGEQYREYQTFFDTARLAGTGRIDEHDKKVLASINGRNAGLSLASTIPEAAAGYVRTAFAYDQQLHRSLQKLQSIDPGEHKPQTYEMIKVVRRALQPHYDRRHTNPPPEREFAPIAEWLSAAERGESAALLTRHQGMALLADHAKKAAGVEDIDIFYDIGRLTRGQRFALPDELR